MALVTRIKALFIKCFSFSRPSTSEQEVHIDVEIESIDEKLLSKHDSAQLSVNREVILDICGSNESALFTAYTLDDTCKLVINGYHPTYCALTSPDESHPLVQWLTTWAKLAHCNRSERCKEVLLVAQKGWESALVDAKLHEINWTYGNLPQSLLFDVSHMQGNPYIIINRDHLFYRQVLVKSGSAQYQEFIKAILAWAVAENNALSQLNRKKMANARELLSTLLHDVIDEALERMEHKS